MKTKLTKATWLFLIATTVFSSLIFIIGGSLIKFIMLVPGISAIIATVFTNRKWSAFGWKFSIKYALLSWLIPILYSALAYVIIWLTGIGDVPNPLFIERAKLTIGLESDSTFQVVTISFFYITIFMLIPAVIFALGEELGWRGLLFPELSKNFSFLKAAILSSFLWAIWHLPAMLLDNYGVEETPFAFRFIMFLLLVVFTGIIMSWIWLKSKSVLAVAIFHASHNVVIQMFFDRITLDKEYTNYFKGEFGIALVITTLIFVYLVLKLDKSFIKNQ
ncbi:type II CAAX endopeptidase family protein [Gaetbulibacter sp. M235]|uniref:CPBP family intramembrane glutamic endopeptidase n=1 Tax=Gaetbulibacter sp. M235 TaxID=3126510 RepID=UPI00374EAE14